MRGPGGTAAAGAAILIVLSGAVDAKPLEVKVVDADGQPVAGVVAFIEGEGRPRTDAPTEPAVMDQVDKQFVPHVLVVQKGTPVRFPNSDPVAHHVYSFSRPNAFTLPLYKGNAHEPITFMHEGVVTLGCNIHDNMLGYIVVVDTGAFGMTDDSGIVALEVGHFAGDASVRIWSPRIRDDSETLVRPLDVATATSQVVEFRLGKRLRPPHENHGASVEWSDY